MPLERFFKCSFHAFRKKRKKKDKIEGIKTKQKKNESVFRSNKILKTMKGCQSALTSWSLMHPHKIMILNEQAGVFETISTSKHVKRITFVAWRFSYTRVDFRVGKHASNVISQLKILCFSALSYLYFYSTTLHSLTTFFTRHTMRIVHTRQKIVYSIKNKNQTKNTKHV